MKRVLLPFLMLFAFAAEAQVSGLGGKGGLNFSNVVGEGRSGSTRTSIHLGGYYNHMITDVVAIQPELVYSLQGAKDNGSTLRLNYLNIPVMVKDFLQKEIYVNGGPELGINVVSEVENKSVTVDIDASGIVFGLGLGAGYEMENGLNFAIRYNFGLTSVFQEGSSARNSVIQLTVGYQFTQDALF